MNTIPLIFNERQIERTVLGGKNTQTADHIDTSSIPCSLILLCRGSNHYRQQNIDNLLKLGFSEIISIENSSMSYNLEEFAHRHPQVKFVVPLEKVSTGDMINIGIAESTCEFAFVIWNDIHISQSILTKTLFEKLTKHDILCCAPLLQSSTSQNLPTEMIPTIEKTIFTVLPSVVRLDKSKTLYPFDSIGIYHRKKFMQLGGYDYTITNPYWQNLDFSLRAWLWGEKIKIFTHFKIKYEDESPLEDITADYTQLRFYLKNCAPSFKFDYSYIPISRYFSFQNSYPGNPIEALRVFKDARKWVQENKYRFKTDVSQLVESWNDIDDDHEEDDS